jgi:transcriptional regulator with XRE-family HTH domain
MHNDDMMSGVGGGGAIARLMPGLRIAELRERRRLTPWQLGLLALNHPDPVHATEHDKTLAGLEIERYERGECFPSWERVIAIAQVLGCEDALELFEPMPIKKWKRRLDAVEHLYAPQWDRSAQAVAQRVPDSSTA